MTKSLQHASASVTLQNAILSRLDPYTYTHQIDVMKYARLYAHYYPTPNRPDIDRGIIIGCGLHDIGKLAIVDALKDCRNRELLPDAPEWVIIHQHPALGLAMLTDYLEAVDIEPWLRVIILSIAGSHHERWDGTGYPNRLKGDEIPEPARLAGVLDAVAAMSGPDRPWIKPKSYLDIRNELLRHAGRQFDPFFAHRVADLLVSENSSPSKQESINQEASSLS